MSRGQGRAVAAVIVAALLLVAGCDAPATFGTDADNADTPNPYGWFEGGLEWRGDFPDPHVVRLGNMYYAYATSMGGRYLPVTYSADLVHWYAHSRWDPIPPEVQQSSLSDVDKRNLNDALLRPPSWAVKVGFHPWVQTDVWAPGVIQIGSTWFAYSAVKASNESDDPNGFGRFCITVATAPTPLGPFRDISGERPVVCNSEPAGSLDPSPFFDPVSGRYYLLWKAAGARGSHSSAIAVQRIGLDGFPIGQGTKLLTTNEGSWEGSTIENPSMVYFNDVYYLFYSGNSFLAGTDGTSSYATGYAICRGGPMGRCTRMTVAQPLLASNGDVQGPGGASGFVDGAGNLRLAYHSYQRGENRGGWGAHPRRMKIAELSQGLLGELYVR